MKIDHIYVFDQKSQEPRDLAERNGTSKEICGYAVCGLCQYLAEVKEVNEEILKSINFKVLESYIESSMKFIKSTRKIEIKKFFNRMSETEKKNTFTNEVAPYEISNFLESISKNFSKNQFFFFRQCIYTNPEALKQLKFEEAERAIEEEQLKNHKYFYTAFNSYQNKEIDRFPEEIKELVKNEVPIIIATDVYGHFNVCVLMLGNIYVLDSLMYSEGNFDINILETIANLYKKTLTDI